MPPLYIREEGHKRNELLSFGHGERENKSMGTPFPSRQWKSPRTLALEEIQDLNLAMSKVDDGMNDAQFSAKVYNATCIALFCHAPHLSFTKACHGVSINAT